MFIIVFCDFEVLDIYVSYIRVCFVNLGLESNLFYFRFSCEILVMFFIFMMIYVVIVMYLNK